MHTACYYSSKQSEQPVTDGEIRDRLHASDGMLWLDFTKPSPEELTLLSGVFDFHPLAIEDVGQPDQRPKVVEYGSYVFVVAHEFQVDSSTDPASKPFIKRRDEINAFVGHNFVVTIHQGDSPTLKTAQKRWEQSGALQQQGPYFFLYLLLDSLVDDYYPALDVYDEQIDFLEQLVLRPANEEYTILSAQQKENADQKPLKLLLQLRRDLLEMRRYVAPLRDAVNVLLRRVESYGQSDDSHQDRARTLFTYFQDVYDHTIRVVDTIDTYRDLLSGTLDAHLAVASNRLNEIVKVLTSVSIILMTWATITGIYGMNFVHIPELHWRYGYLYVWGLFVVTGVGEWFYFRRRKWL